MGAVVERIGRDAGDAVGDGDVGQAGAADERPAPDTDDAGGDRDICQAGAVKERSIAYVGDTRRDRITSCPTRWISNERALALVEQYPVHTAVVLIGRIHGDGRQARGVKRKFPNAGDAGGDRDFG